MKMRMPRPAISALFFLSFLVFLSCGKAYALHILHSYEFGIGTGINTDGEDTKQVLLYPSVNWFLDKYPFLVLHLEADFELIVNGSAVYIAGIAPFLRYALPLENRWRPFAEVGGGTNVISRNETGDRRLGGAFHFSFMAGVGLEYATGENKAIRLSTRYRHLSNAKIYAQNASINEIMFIIAFGF
jgi:hypothetical protein